MISRFFNTSKPIHSVIIAVFLLVIFVFTRSDDFLSEFNVMLLLKELLKYIIILASVFVLDFLVSKNKLTQKNGYEILIFSLLLAAFPITMKTTNVFVANFFVLLALCRTISLRSNLNVKKKLFDAAFWISIASLFCFWSILFLIIVLAAIILYAIPQIKNWIVPLIGVLTIVLIGISYNIIIGNDLGTMLSFIDGVAIEFLEYSQEIVTALILISSLGAIAMVSYLLKLSNRQKTKRPLFLLIFIAFLVGVTVVIIAPNKNGAELLFVFPALTIIMSNYAESINKPWFAEVYMWLLMLTPLTVLML